MDKTTRAAIEKATQRARKLLEADFAEQLEGSYDILLSGQVAPSAGPHLTPRQRLLREKIVAAVQHKQAAGMKAAEAVADYLRDAAFTTLNRFVALKMLEARGLVQECISKGEQSSGYHHEFCGLAPGIPLLPNGSGYRLYLECILDELSTEVKVLFDRRDAASVLWPSRRTLDELLETLNGPELVGVWQEDETIGWVYQYFNSQDERRAMRRDSQAPQDSRELAVRNQFFTPRYIVQFLTDNTLGRIWYEMRQGQTRLVDLCEYMALRSDEEYEPRTKKDPRDLRILDPACGSGHFLLYAFDLLLVIYEEAWADVESPRSEETGRTLREDHPTLDMLRRELPRLILRYNLHGVDIDPRCAQIAQLALWMRVQRAFYNLGIPPAKRPLIHRSNLVIAEPMPGEVDLHTEFLAGLADSALAAHFDALAEHMKLAGELGLLLRMEELVQPTAGKGENLKLFAPSADRLRAALARFAAEAMATQQARRRLFCDDGVQGLGLVEIADKRFDAVLMNPPFGAPTSAAKANFNPRSDVPSNQYAWFMLRSAELLVKQGLCGCITDSTWLKQPTFQPLRKLLLTDLGLVALVDLGWGVLDANVRTCAQIFLNGPSSTFLIADATEPQYREKVISNPASFSERSTKATLSLPKCVLSPGFGPDEAQELSNMTTLGKMGELPWGCGANDSFRLFRLRWEVNPASNDWTPLTNGGSFSPFYRDNYLVCRTRLGERSAFELKDAAGEKLWDASAQQFIGRKGLTYPKRSEHFHVSTLAPGHVVTPEGKGMFFPDGTDLYLLLALANSSFVGLLASFLCGPHKQRGDVSLIPIPELPQKQALRAKLAARSATYAVMKFFQGLETSTLFVAPHGCNNIESKVDTVARQVMKAIEEIDGSLAESVPTRLEGSVQEHHEELIAEVLGAWKLETASDVAVLSFSVGVSFRRFGLGYALTGGRDQQVDLDPFSPAQRISPAEASADAAPRTLLLDDPGHKDDLVNAALGVLEQLSIQTPDPDSLREWFAKQFFSSHLQMYSKSRRKAPIYWQLATPSASYSVWLYIHAFNRDTLYQVQEIAELKLRHEERKLESLRAESGASPTAAQRKVLESQESFVEELRAFLEEVKRVAPLWNPNLDDGVIINFAPLWRLVPHHKPWQKELKATWDALCAGECEWAHLAMHLWPERVVPKCATDRSLAIAHGLEDVFWMEGEDGKWKPRPVPTRPVKELVSERTSPAVKASLEDLLQAPVAPSGGGRGRPRRGRRAGGATV